MDVKKPAGEHRCGGGRGSGYREEWREGRQSREKVKAIILRGKKI